MEIFIKAIFITLTLWGLVLTLPGATVAACNNGPDKGGVVGNRECDNQVKIGSSVVLTGPLAKWGNEIARVGPRAYFNMINERGGVHGRKIEYIIYDDSFRPERAFANVKKLIEKDRVLSLLLQTGTITNTTSYTYVTEEKKIPLFFPASGSHFWVSPFKRYVFPLPPSTAMQTYILVDYLVITGGFKKIGIFFHDSPLGDEVREPALKRLDEYGLKPIGQEKLKMEEFDVSGQVMKLRSLGAEAVILGVPYNWALRFMSEAKKIDWRAQVGGMSLVGFHTASGLENEMVPGYVMVMTMPDAKYAPGPAMEEYREHLRKYYPGAPLSAGTLTGWWAAKVLTEVLLRAGRELTVENVIKAAEGIRDYETGITGPISFYPQDHSGTTRGYIAVAKAKGNGALQLVPLGSNTGLRPEATPLWLSSWGKSVEEVAPIYEGLRRFAEE